MAKYVRVDTDGNSLGFFSDDIAPPPQDAVEIPDALWREWIGVAGTHYLDSASNTLKPHPVAVDLAATKAAALAAIVTMLEEVADAYTGKSPLAERLSWATKEAAAKAYVSGTATADQLAMLETEATMTGEAVEDLANTILDTAASYWTAAGAIAGLRRSFAAAIANAKTVDAVNKVLADAPAQIHNVFRQ